MGLLFGGSYGGHSSGVQKIMERRIVKRPIGVLQDQVSDLIDEVWKSGKVRAWVEVGEWLRNRQDWEGGLGELIELFEEEFLDS